MPKNKTEITISDFSDEELRTFRITVGKNVAKIRKSKGLSQLDLSHLIGCSSVSLVSGAEIGFNTVKFNLDHLYKISKVLDVDIRDFFSETI